MFGELDDSNIYESFDAFSDGNEQEDDGVEFSFSDEAENNAGIQGSDDFLDMSSYSERLEQSQGNIPGVDTTVPSGDYVASQEYVPEMEDVQQGYDSVDAESPEVQVQSPTQVPDNNKSSGVFFLLVLLLLAAVAGGLFYYKNYMAPNGGTQEQASGDYFYDQATEQGAVSPQGEAADSKDGQGSVATVDVDLNTPVGQTQDVNAKNDAVAFVQPKSDEALTPLEKAQLKEKMDEQKDSKNSFANRVTIPVVAGGRVDPFVPFMQRVSAINAPKFDLIAPPTSVPEADPVVDQIVQTKISGIMFDTTRPSAIINIGGVDQLVHKGDVVNGFSVLNITKKSVTLKYGANVYQASVGESVGEGVNLNPVSNLNHSFGGAYSKTPSNAIHF